MKALRSPLHCIFGPTFLSSSIFTYSALPSEVASLRHSSTGCPSIDTFLIPEDIGDSVIDDVDDVIGDVDGVIDDVGGVTEDVGSGTMEDDGGKVEKDAPSCATLSLTLSTTS